jgi:hypothetical protein
VLDRTPGIFERHSRYFGKQPDKIVVVDHLDTEANVRSHNAGRTGRRQLQAIALLLSGFDRALDAPSLDPTSIDDEAGAEEIGEFGKHDLIALLREYLLAEIRLRGPGSGQFERPNLNRQQGSKDKQCDG